MNVADLKVQGACLIETKVHSDTRGIFAVFWDAEMLSGTGIPFAPSNAHHSFNRRAGTIRGLHYQAHPHEQAKLVTCVSGVVWDVVVDLRPGSPTYLAWSGTELEAASGRAVFVPRGCAHGFATLEDNSTVAYLIEGQYDSPAGRVLRWDDPRVGIRWPVENPILSSRDRQALLMEEI